MDIGNAHVGVIGLGYVGLPLAVEFAKHGPVLGFDINQQRIEELVQGTDHTLEVASADLAAANTLTFSSELADLAQVNTYVVTTPTPVDEHKRPDLGPVLAATRAVASCLDRGDVVIYESTVYPGATEECCVPLLEEISGLRFNSDFFVGYSPERINPGDREHRLPTIVKVTSGSTPDAAEYVDELYRSIITAGTHKAASIKVAEAAKVIENTQRDVNIALMNELSMLFGKLGIDTLDVLEAAGTKWNFLPFRPGLVGGHCIGVDPYYLTHKAQAVGHHPEMILAGRRLNDSMGSYVVSQVVKEATRRGILMRDARVLVLGMTFKEGTPDLRNSKVIDIVTELQEYGARVDVTDPWANAADAKAEFGVELVERPEANTYDVIVIAVAHPEFRKMSADSMRAWGKNSDHVLFDLKGVFPASEVDLRL